MLGKEEYNESDVVNLTIIPLDWELLGNCWTSDGEVKILPKRPFWIVVANSGIKNHITGDAKTG
jgi:hypothetical protein